MDHVLSQAVLSLPGIESAGHAEYANAANEASEELPASVSVHSIDMFVDDLLPEFSANNLCGGLGRLDAPMRAIQARLSVS